MNTTCRQSLLQPVGGMGRIGEAFGRELGSLIRYNAKVTEIRQNDRGVTVRMRTYAHRDRH
jgi:monoamine oxidase